MSRAAEVIINLVTEDEESQRRFYYLVGKQAQFFVDLVGWKGAVNLIVKHGGNRLRIPKRPKPNHRLAELVGHDGMLKLCQSVGGEQPITIPRCDLLWREYAVSLYRAGKPAGLIARYLKVHEGTVYHWIQQHQAQRYRDGQPDLFP